MTLKREKKEKLKNLARKFRRDIVKMLTKAGSGHPGGSLSATDILTVLYFHTMNYRKDDPDWEERDRFVLSKGHACPALYAVFTELEWIPREQLDNLRTIDGVLQGHPDMLVTEGIEISTGSLGQGLSAGNGMAISTKLDHIDSMVYVLLGDGEIQEGMVWEAAMSASHYELDNVCAIIDRNDLQIDGKVDNIMNLEPLEDKWKSFGWHTRIINGHDYDEISRGLEWAKDNQNKPTLIIARTVKGKGVSFMEGENKFHGVTPTDEECAKALEELQ